MSLHVANKVVIFHTHTLSLSRTKANVDRRPLFADSDFRKIAQMRLGALTVVVEKFQRSNDG